MNDIPARIIENREIAPGCFMLSLVLAEAIDEASPGQFAMIRVPGNEVFLRRPFGICTLRDCELTMMYKVVGTGTDLLSKAPAGAETMVLGPLGRGFHPSDSGPCIVVAGGIGLAGVHLLAERLGKRAILVYGCGTGAETSLVTGLPDADVRVATIDGSHGFHGSVIELLALTLRNQTDPSAQIFACGPHGMLRALRALLEEERTPCQVLVEERMACGMGLCFGCVVKTIDDKDPYKRVCKEGPVFDLWQLSL